MTVTDSEIFMTNLLLGFFALLFIAGMGAIIYSWQIRGRGLEGANFPVTNATSGLGPIST